MSTLFTCILYKSNQFSADIILEAIRAFKKRSSIEYPFQHETFVKMDIALDVEGVFYLVNEYEYQTQNFACQCEVFREDNFLGLLAEIATEKKPEFCFYGRIFNDMNGNHSIFKYQNNYYESREIIDGCGYSCYLGKDGAYHPESNELNLDSQKYMVHGELDEIQYLKELDELKRPFDPSVFTLEELKINDEQLVCAFENISSQGDVVCTFSRE